MKTHYNHYREPQSIALNLGIPDIANKEAHNLEFNFSPQHKPYLPDDIHWFHNEPTWVRIAESRLKGTMVTASVELKYENDFQVNENKMRDIKAELKAFGLGTEGQYVSNTDEKRIRKKDVLLKYDVIFAPCDASEVGVS